MDPGSKGLLLVTALHVIYQCDEIAAAQTDLSIKNGDKVPTKILTWPTYDVAAIVLDESQQKLLLHEADQIKFEKLRSQIGRIDLSADPPKKDSTVGLLGTSAGKSEPDASRMRVTYYTSAGVHLGHLTKSYPSVNRGLLDECAVFLHYGGNAMPGSSGGPVLDDAHPGVVVGMHQGGVDANNSWAILFARRNALPDQATKRYECHDPAAGKSDVLISAIKALNIKDIPPTPVLLDQSKCKRNQWPDFQPPSWAESGDLQSEYNKNPHNYLNDIPDDDARIIAVRQRRNLVFGAGLYLSPSVYPAFFDEWKVQLRGSLDKEVLIWPKDRPQYSLAIGGVVAFGGGRQHQSILAPDRQTVLEQVDGAVGGIDVELHLRLSLCRVCRPSRWRPSLELGVRGGFSFPTDSQGLAMNYQVAFPVRIRLPSFLASYRNLLAFDLEIAPGWRFFPEAYYSGVGGMIEQTATVPHFSLFGGIGGKYEFVR